MLKLAVENNRLDLVQKCLFGALERLQILFATTQKASINLEPLLLQTNLQRLSPLTTLIASLVAEDKKLAMLSLLLTVAPEKQLMLQPVELGQAAGPLPIVLVIESSTEKVVAYLLQFIPQQQLAQKSLFEAPLAHAMLKQKTKMVKLLLPYQEQFLFELESGEQISLLHLAVLDHDMLKMLLSSSLCRKVVNFPNKIHGTTPLHIAVQYRQLDAAVTLLEYGANINQCDLRGWAPIHVACEFGEINLFKLLVNKQADLNLVIKAGRAPLHIAAQHGNLAIMRELIQLNTLINPENSFEVPPLFIAIFGRHKPVVEWLLESGANPNAMVKTLESAISLMFFAYQVNNYHAIKCLLDYGADLNQSAFIKDKASISMMSFINAIRRTQPELYRIFKQKIPKISTIESKAIPATAPIFESAENAASKLG